MAKKRTTAPKKFCFVLMPFSDTFADVYSVGIKEACENAGAYCERVDEQIFHESILDRIYNQIAKADIVIADLTGRNPNVFYEVGYAHALNKLTILLTQLADDIPFDLKHYPHIIYGSKVSTLRSELEKRISYYIENPPIETSDYKQELGIYLDKDQLSDKMTELVIPVNSYPLITLIVHNQSGLIFNSGDYKIGILSRLYSNSNATSHRNMKLPSGENLIMLHGVERLLPGEYENYELVLYPPFDSQLGRDEFVER